MSIRDTHNFVPDDTFIIRDNNDIYYICSDIENKIFERIIGVLSNEKKKKKIVEKNMAFPEKKRKKKSHQSHYISMKKKKTQK